MTDINQLKRSLSRRGQRPALSPDGEPFLTRTANTPGVSFISTEQFVDELAKKRKEIHFESLVISDRKPEVKTPTPTPPAKAEKPKTPTPQAKVWTREELEQLPWKDLRKLSTLWDDVHGNKGKDHILEGMTGKSKTPPPQE